MKRDIINFVFGFVCGCVIFYVMIQSSIIQMELRIQQDKLNKGDDVLKFPKEDKSLIRRKI